MSGSNYYVYSIYLCGRLQSRLSTLFNTTAAQHKRHEQNFTNRALLECLFAKQGNLLLAQTKLIKQ